MQLSVLAEIVLVAVSLAAKKLVAAVLAAEEQNTLAVADPELAVELGSPTEEVLGCLAVHVPL